MSDPQSSDKAAEMEKNKGNEAFKAGDYEESINYYSNSIDILPTAATFNNRGLASQLITYVLYLSLLFSFIFDGLNNRIFKLPISPIYHYTSKTTLSIGSKIINSVK